MVLNTKLNHVPTCKDKNGRVPSAALATILTDYVLSAWRKLLTILAKDGSGEEVLLNLAVLLKRALHFLPGHELVHLLGQVPEFLTNKPIHRMLKPVPKPQHSADAHSTKGTKLYTVNGRLPHSSLAYRVCACISGLYLDVAVAMLRQQFPQHLCIY